MARKNKSTISADDLIRQMYPDLPTSDDIKPTENSATQDDATRQIAALQAQIARLEGQISAAPRSAPVQRTAPRTPPVRPTVIDDDNMPDPVTDPVAYKRAVQQQTQALINYEKEMFAYQQEQQAQSAARVSALWEGFKSAHPEYAADEEKIEIAASRVLQKAVQKGVDADDYMYGRSPDFMKDVTAEFDRIFGKPKSDDDDNDGDEDGDEDEDIRTDIIGAGAPGGTSKKGAAPPVSPFGALSQSIMAWQEKTGFHR